jgi:hypothetical protein
VVSGFLLTFWVWVGTIFLGNTLFLQLGCEHDRLNDYNNIFHRGLKMIKKMVFSVLLLAAIVALTGCSPESKPWGLEAPGLTREQVNQRHVEAMQVDSWQLQDDIDAFFLFDRPGRMNRLVVR